MGHHCHCSSSFSVRSDVTCRFSISAMSKVTHARRVVEASTRRGAAMRAGLGKFKGLSRPELLVDATSMEQLALIKN